MNEHARRELEWTWTGSGTIRPLQRGDSGTKVRHVQEWLTLHGHGTAIDGDFGPATEAAVRSFLRFIESANGEARERGIIDAESWGWLTDPMRRVVEWKRQAWPKRSDGDAIVDCAHAHLGAHPREVGGPNSGPWVRLYMDGHEGKDWPWCAGFATYVLRQALGHDKWRTFSCDELAAKAKREHLLRWADEREGIWPGCLFLIRDSLAPEDSENWVHCGIVTAVGPHYFETIEGNTNQGGSREGMEVCKRTRAFNNRTDFILIGDGA